MPSIREGQSFRIITRNTTTNAARYPLSMQLRLSGWPEGTWDYMASVDLEDVRNLSRYLQKYLIEQAVDA